MCKIFFFRAENYGLFQFKEKRKHDIGKLCASTVKLPELKLLMNYDHVLAPGFVTDEEVKRRELRLRDALKNDREFRVKEGASVEVSQVRSVVNYL